MTPEQSTLSNSPTHYGAVAKTFHWATALVILTLIPLGIITADLPYETSQQLARKAWLFSLHKTLGVAVFFLALARIAWALVQPRPGLLNAERRAEAGLAHMVHWLLYGSLVAVPLSGWIHHAATTGFAPIWWPFGQSLPFVPQSESLSETAAGLHYVLQWVLTGAIGLHVAGALKHHFIDRDATLLRMLPGKRPALPRLSQAHGGALPLVAALLIWAAAIGTGSAFGLYAQPHEEIAAVQPAALPQAGNPAPAQQGDAPLWAVQDGTLGITVRQFGSEVTGSFANWEATIAYDPEAPANARGQVEVSVAIPSLTLGSVTKQAMGADFFHAEEYPRAVFAAELTEGVDEILLATGTLTLRGTEVPVELPVDLHIENGTATASGTLTLDRRDFGIGDNMTDEGQLAYPVEVRFELTANRTDPAG